MDLPVNHFKRAIASGKTPIGAWLVSAAPSAAEALGYIGFDFLVVDMEHTPLDTPQMIGILQTIAGTPAQAIVRPPWNDMVMVKRALDHHHVVPRSEEHTSELQSRGHIVCRL